MNINTHVTQLTGRPNWQICWKFLHFRHTATGRDCM